jgi:putative addiction module component (TIGR02574 family)
MSSAAAAILEQVSHLTDAECELVYRGLEERLYGATESGGEPLSDEMKQTLDRRWDEIVSGKVKCIPHDEVMTKMRAKYGI